MAVVIRRKFGTLTIAPLEAGLAVRYRGIDDLRHAAPAPIEFAITLPGHLLPRLCAACLQLAQGLPARALVGVGSGRTLTLYPASGACSAPAVPDGLRPAFLRIRYGSERGQCVRFTIRPMELIMVAMTCGRVLDRTSIDDLTSPADRASPRSQSRSRSRGVPQTPGAPRPRATFF